MVMMDQYIDIVFDLPVKRSFTYELPPHLRERAVCGVRARAPWGSEIKIGLIIGPTKTVPETEIKPIFNILDDRPITTPEIIKLCMWISSYYYCSLGETVRAATGPIWPVYAKTVVFPAPDRWQKSAAELQRLPKTARDILASLSGNKGTPQARIAEMLGQARAQKALARLESDGWIRRREIKRTVPVPADALILRSTQTAESTLPEDIRRALATVGPGGVARHEFAQGHGVSERKLAGWLREETIRWRPAPPPADLDYDRPGLTAPLTAEQRRAVDALSRLLKSSKPKPALLFGVTGSGKTRVYLELAKQVLDSGKRVLVLVPEIVLAQGAAGLWSLIFPGRVALWHSAMKSSDRYWIYKKIIAGEYDIVIGARSAIFAPLSRLGMIIVDEEHADTYKQSEPNPRYHARDAAVIRAKQENCLCILGSATPSVESFYNARRGKYELIELKRRVPGRQLPVVQLVDLAGRRVATKEKSGAVFTTILRDRLAETIDNDQQVILFLNRRGHSTMVTCSLCGWRLECPHCGITLTYHLTDHSYHCHLCRFTKPAESTCPNCGNHKFGFRGMGTQKVEEQLHELNPEWKVDRLDTDTVAAGRSVGEVLSRFSAGKTDILVGTQMVAKGLDFARVGLVGVIWADRHLSFPDFRAEEKTFQLVTQVAGRSGRGREGGTVVVQTFHPEHQLIELAAAQDYIGFFEREIKRRRELSYPPYTRLLRLEFSSTDEDAAYQAARDTVKKLDQVIQHIPGTFRILGPAPAPIIKIRRRYRWRILLKTKSIITLLTGLGAQLDEIEATSRKKKNLRLAVDVDPIDFL
jgi:primosomal protein N' (replication factor Y)